jgi:hypothetical protein
MQVATSDGVAQATHDQNDAYRATVSDLVRLIEHIQTSLRLIERAISQETSPDASESSTNVIPLEDSSPIYMKATTTLQTCDADLGMTKRGLLDTRDRDHRAARRPKLTVVKT